MSQGVEARKTVNLLIVEDNATDVFLTREILSESEKNYYKLSAVKDGVEALAFLQKTNGYKESKLPDLILLDLNLPRMHGFDLLARIKTSPEFKAIPVCILTTSESNADIEKASKLKADCYLVKPLDLEKFEAAFCGLAAR